MAIMALLAVGQLTLGGCQTRVLYTAHPQVLVERRGDSYVQLAEDDPRYERLASYLAADAALARLLQGYESTTAAFAAAHLRSPARVAVVNHAVVVLGADPILLRDVPVQGVYADVTIEFALGVPVTDPAELSESAPDLARSIGEAVMGLAGRDLAAADAAADDILACGLGAALEAWYVAESDAPQATTARTAGWAPEASGCPEVAGAFLQRLMVAPQHGYPQRYMLWFANYQAQDEALAKIVLAAYRTRGNGTLTAFASAYATAFPGERESVAQLVAELLGPEAASELGGGPNGR